MGHVNEVVIYNMFELRQQLIE